MSARYMNALKKDIFDNVCHSLVHSPVSEGYSIAVPNHEE